MSSRITLRLADRSYRSFGIVTLTGCRLFDLDSEWLNADNVGAFMASTARSIEADQAGCSSDRFLDLHTKS